MKDLDKEIEELLDGFEIFEYSDTAIDQASEDARTNRHDFNRAIKQLISEVIDEIIGEDEYSSEFSGERYAPLEFFNERLARNELRQDQRAKKKSCLAKPG